MKDLVLIALYAFLGAAAAGLIGAGALWRLRHRSVALSVTVISAVAVTAMLAGTLAVARAMFLSPHDLKVVTLVVAMAAVVSLATALLLGRWVVAGSRALTLAARSFGDGGDFAVPGGAPPPSWPTWAGSWRRRARNSPCRAAANRRWRPPGVSWWRGSRTICGHRSPGCGRCPRRWRTGWPPTPNATSGRSAPRWTG